MDIEEIIWENYIQLYAKLKTQFTKTDRKKKGIGDRDNLIVINVLEFITLNLPTVKISGLAGSSVNSIECFRKKNFYYTYVFTIGRGRITSQFVL